MSGDAANNSGLKNALDRFIRHYSRVAYYIAVVALYFLTSLILGLALAPALWMVAELLPLALQLTGWWRWILAGSLLAGGAFLSGFCLLVVVALANKILPTRIERFKGGYYSVAAVPWYLHNGLFYLARFTFLPFVTLTPFGIWFLRAMGMRMGKDPFINTEYISDPQLLRLGDDVAIGGSVRIFAHYGGGGHFVIEPVEIGDRATIGLGATIMGDVKIGARATLLPHSVLLPGSRVGEGETWGGVPARRISREEMERIKAEIRGGQEAEGEPLL